MTGLMTASPQASRRSSRVLLGCLPATLLLTFALTFTPVASADANTPRTPVKPARAAAIGATEAQTLDMLLASLPERYASAHPAHDVSATAPLRSTAAAVRARALQAGRSLSADPSGARALASLGVLTHTLQATARQYQPWPLSFEVSALVARTRRQLAVALHPPPWPRQPYERIDPTLARAVAHAKLASTNQRQALAARADLLRAYALYLSGPGKRLFATDPALDAQITQTLAGAAQATSTAAGGRFEGSGEGAHVVQLAKRAQDEVELAGQVLGLVTVSHATIVVNGAIIVFREGLEAVLILAAITASFTGAKRKLRRPVLIGALAGLAATVLTWVVAQVLLHLLGDGGLRLQAITGLIAIGVLLLVTNWFFHRMYWSEWISRFNRRRKAIERLDRLGFLSGQVIGLLLLGLSSVYREGLETVLFLQALQTSAGLGAAALGAGIGLAATLIVGVITFRLQRKLPFKRMLIVTGVLIALVLAVMVGTTVHNMQGIGWLPSTSTTFEVPTDWSTWLGVFPTWQGIAAQLGALIFVLGSYFAARELQVRGPRRRALRGTTAPASRVGAADA
jgi:high-affinity iron transporter